MNSHGITLSEEQTDGFGDLSSGDLSLVYPATLHRAVSLLHDRPPDRNWIALTSRRSTRGFKGVSGPSGPSSHPHPALFRRSTWRFPINQCFNGVAQLPPYVAPAWQSSPVLSAEAEGLIQEITARYEQLCDPLQKAGSHEVSDQHKPQGSACDWKRPMRISLDREQRVPVPPRLLPEGSQPLGGDVRTEHLIAERRQQTSMPPVATGQVQSPATHRARNCAQALAHEW